MNDEREEARDRASLREIRKAIRYERDVIAGRKPPPLPPKPRTPQQIFGVPDDWSYLAIIRVLTGGVPVGPGIHHRLRAAEEQDHKRRAAAQRRVWKPTTTRSPQQVGAFVEAYVAEHGHRRGAIADAADHFEVTERTIRETLKTLREAKGRLAQYQAIARTLTNRK